MFYINTKFGLISELYESRDNEGKRTLKAKHCLDIREALPFETRSQAEAAYRKTYMASWWHCVVASHESKPDRENLQFKAGQQVNPLSAT